VCLEGLFAIGEMLLLANEGAVTASLYELLGKIAAQGHGPA
jgi:hypothetical protein